MEIFFEPASEFKPAVDMFTRPANHPRPWLMSLEMYNDLAPWFGHKPIPPVPLFPITDKFLTNYDKQTSKPMTEQSLIEYAVAGDQGAIDYLAVNGFEGVDWKYAITHVNGRWLPGHEIVLVWNEMVKLQEAHGAPYEEIKAGLQKALDGHNKRTRTISPALAMSPADRPWDFRGKANFKFGRGTNQTPPKKKRK
jgi:hypothetical protein